MKQWFILTVFFMAVLLFGTGNPPKGTSQSQVPGFQPIGKKAAVVPGFGKIPLYFIANKGQVDREALFYAKAGDYTVWITRAGLVFDSVKKAEEIEVNEKTGIDHSKFKIQNSKLIYRDVSRQVFLKANPDAMVVPETATAHRVNYFRGKDRSRWQTGIPTSRAVCYKNLYKRIDLKIYGNRKQVEYDWVVKPGGDPGVIGFRWQGVKEVSTDEEGNLVVRTDGGQWLHRVPVAYQEIPIAGGAGSTLGRGNCPIEHRKVEVAFNKIGKDTYGFKVGKYNKKYPLVIDPLVLAFSTYLGGTGGDEYFDIALGSDGSIYTVGNSTSSDYPTVNGYQETDPGDENIDIVATRFTPDGSGLVYSTYLGGSEWDCAWGSYLDGSGALYVAGVTLSNDFPLVAPYQSTFWGDDGFISKLSADGSSLLYSTYLGGGLDDTISDITLDSSGAIYVCGFTDSSNFPLLNPFDDDLGIFTDGFVTKLTPAGDSLVYSTFLGGGYWDYCDCMLVTGSGEAVVAGRTESPDFPIYNAYQVLHGGGESDGFVTRLSANGSSLLYSTYLGGSGSETMFDMAMDSSGALYLVGYSVSLDFPTTPGAFDETGGGGFVSKLAPNGLSLEYSTYMDGQVRAIAVDNGGNAYVAGFTASPDFPVQEAFKYMLCYEDAYVTRLNPSGSGIIFSSLLGGCGGGEVANGIAVDGSGAIYLAGTTYSNDFPVYNAYQGNLMGTNNGFVTKLIMDPNAALTITSPNGGEYWNPGTEHVITWNSTSTGMLGDLYLYYSNDNGNSWSFVNYGEPIPNTGAYTWTVPEASSTQYLVKIQDYAGNLADTSDAVFTVAPPPAITVYLPNGEEQCYIGSTFAIYWEGTVGISSVNIEYSIDNGNSWETIASSFANNVYEWTVPNTPSTNALVRISDTAGSASDVSDGVFTILPYPIVTVTAPNGGEIWVQDTVRTITWNTTGAIANVSIEYSTDGGASWNYVIYWANTGSYNWQVPMVQSTNCLVKVIHGETGVEDVSDAVFTIAAPTITVTSPNGGENWESNTAHDITWTSMGNINSVQLKYSTNNGSSWNIISTFTANDGAYNWTVPNTPSANCLVKVSDSDHPLLSDQSNAVFTIAAQRTITVTAPNGGETWEGAIAHNITWTSTGAIANVKLEYSTDNGSSWNTIADSAYNGGAYFWTTPNSPSTNCLVKVSDTAGPASDQSNGVFTIAAQRTITVTSPNGGETWEGTTAHNITWTSTGSIANVKLEYSTNNGSSWNTIIASTANSGTYNWTVPNAPSAACLVRITDTAGPATDNSDALFTITAHRTITVTAPDGGQRWFIDTTYAITWSSTGSISNVMIEYSTNSGSSWNTIIASTSNTGTYNWTIPNTPSVNCLVRISDTSGTASDVSNAVFTIDPYPTVTVTAPNGGETWIAYTTHTITWTNIGTIATVNLEYSTNNGTSWTSIASSVSNTGSYNWVIPYISSINCLVRVSDTATTASDTSNAVFTLELPPSLTVTSPNGGESWVRRSTHTITWTWTGTVGNVKIQYTMDAGSSWTTIISSTPNDGSYQWTLPNVTSNKTQCLVKIEAINGSAVDTSDTYFTILK